VRKERLVVFFLFIAKHAICYSERTLSIALDIKIITFENYQVKK